MIVKYCFKGLSKKEEDFVQKYCPSKIEHVEKRLTHFAKDAVILNMNVSRFDKHNAYAVEFILKLPKKTIVAKEASHTLNKAIDFAKDRLIRQIKKHDALLKKEFTYDREHASSIRDLEPVNQDSLSRMSAEMFA